MIERSWWLLNINQRSWQEYVSAHLNQQCVYNHYSYRSSSIPGAFSRPITLHNPKSYSGSLLKGCNAVAGEQGEHRGLLLSCQTTAKVISVTGGQRGDELPCPRMWRRGWGAGVEILVCPGKEAAEQEFAGWFLKRMICLEILCWFYVAWRACQQKRSGKLLQLSEESSEDGM